MAAQRTAEDSRLEDGSEEDSAADSAEDKQRDAPCCSPDGVSPRACP